MVVSLVIEAVLLAAYVIPTVVMMGIYFKFRKDAALRRYHPEVSLLACFSFFVYTLLVCSEWVGVHCQFRVAIGLFLLSLVYVLWMYRIGQYHFVFVLTEKKIMVFEAAVVDDVDDIDSVRMGKWSTFVLRWFNTRYFPL